MGNALGGVVTQTVFLVFADIAYRRANLEHGAASPENLSYSAQLLLFLSFIPIAALGPETTLWHVHPLSIALPLAYLFGIRLVYQLRQRPVWFPRETAETRLDEPETDGDGRATWRLWARFVPLALVLMVAGWAVGRAGESLAQQTAISETAIGALLMGVVTSLPELVTSIAAVRAGALTLAVGDIVGGNVFELLFISASDVAYTAGSIYHASAIRRCSSPVWPS